MERVGNGKANAACIGLFTSICLPTTQVLYIKATIGSPLLPTKPARETALSFACLLLHCSIELVNTFHKLLARLVLVFLGLGLGFSELGLCVSSLLLG